MIGTRTVASLWGGGEIHLDGLGNRENILMALLVRQDWEENLSSRSRSPSRLACTAPCNQDGMTGNGLLHGVGDLPQQGVQIPPSPEILQPARLDLRDIQQTLPPAG